MPLVFSDEIRDVLVRTHAGRLSRGAPREDSATRIRQVKEPIVYSTGGSRMCARCGWPAADCHCSRTLAPADEPLPATIHATLRIEKRGAGKTVTVLDALPKNAPFLRGLARDLKKACGSGGSAGEGFVEIQGDQRERLRELLAKRDWKVKG